MKNIKFILALFLLISVFGCEESTSLNKNDNIEIKEIIDAEVVYRSDTYDFIIDDVDGYIIIENKEYSGSCESTSFLVNSKFDTPGEDVGTVKIQEKEIQKIQENNEFRYRKELLASDVPDVLASNLVDCDYSSSSISEYASFNKELYFPRSLCVETSIGSRWTFPKDEDLEIIWEQDSEIEYVYIAICAAGSPCIFKEVEDSGRLVISKSEFSKFQTGAFVSFHIGRGLGDMIEMTNGKKVGIIRANISRVPGLTVE